MTGIAFGLAALAGVAFGPWGMITVGIALLLLVLRAWPHVPTALCFSVLVVAAVGAWRGGEARVTVPLAALPSFRSAVVVGLPTYAGRYQHFVAASLPGVETPAPSSERLCVTANPVPRVRLGDELELRGEVELLTDAAPSTRAYLVSRGCAGSMFATSVQIARPGSGIRPAIGEFRARLGQVLRASAPGDAGILLAGLVTGDDAALSDERETAFIATGTTHLTAVSGSNLALVVGLLAALGRNSLGQHHRLWQTVTILGIWSYAVISGAQAPTVRAAIVAMAAILAVRFGRAPDFPTLILLAAGAMVLLDPAQVDRLGFRLSVAAALAITVVLPQIAAGGWGRTAGAVTAIVAAQLATLPILFATFGTFSLLSVPANVLVIPLVALAMPIAAVAGIVGLVSPPLAEIIVTPAALAANGILAIVDLLGAPQGLLVVGIPPDSVVIVLAVACLACLLVLSPEIDRAWIRWGRAANTSSPGTEANENRPPVSGGGSDFEAELPSGGGGGDHPMERPTARLWTQPWQRGRRASPPGSRSSDHQ